MKAMFRRDPTASAGPKAATRQLLGIQYLRAVAALMVALLHTTIQIPEQKHYFDLVLIGRLNLASGVDIFFVISGFIMMVSSRTSTPTQFAVRRIVRIVPLYWVLTLLLVLLAAIKPDLFRTTVVTFKYVVKSLLFIPYLNPGHPGEVVPLLGPGWSLNFEMFFYLIFAVTLYAPERMRVAIVGVVFGALLICGWLAPPGTIEPELRFYTDSRLLEFWLGMLIAHFYLRGDLRFPRWLSIALVAGGMLTILTASLGTNLDPEPVQTLSRNVFPAATIILGMLALEKVGSLPTLPLLHELGDASYSLYLTHIFALGAARYVWVRLGFDHPGTAYAIGFASFGMLIVVVVAWATYRLVETPMLLAMQDKVRRLRRKPQTTGNQIEPPARA